MSSSLKLRFCRIQMGDLLRTKSSPELFASICSCLANAWEKGAAWAGRKMSAKDGSVKCCVSFERSPFVKGVKIWCDLVLVLMVMDLVSEGLPLADMKMTGLDRSSVLNSASRVRLVCLDGVRE